MALDWNTRNGRFIVLTGAHVMRKGKYAGWRLDKVIHCNPRHVLGLHHAAHVNFFLGEALFDACVLRVKEMEAEAARYRAARRAAERATEARFKWEEEQRIAYLNEPGRYRAP